MAIVKWNRGEKKGPLRPGSRFGWAEMECRCGKCIEQVFDDRLIDVIEDLRQKMDRPLIVNRCYSCVEHNKKVGGSPNSNHLRGAAIDIADPKGDIYNWIKLHPTWQRITAWFEERMGGWQHIQVVAPRSGNRWFKP